MKIRKKTLKYVIKTLKEIQDLNDKNFDYMIEKETTTSKSGIRNSKMEDYIEDLLGIFEDLSDNSFYLS